MSTTPEPGWRFSSADLRRIVVATGKSDEQIAADMDTTWWRLHELMSGRKRPSLGMVIRLADELGCHPGDLFEPVPQVSAGPCPICDEPVPPSKGGGTPKVYCSARCRVMAANRRNNPRRVYVGGKQQVPA